VRRIY